MTDGRVRRREGRKDERKEVQSLSTLMSSLWNDVDGGDPVSGLRIGLREGGGGERKSDWIIMKEEVKQIEREGERGIIQSASTYCRRRCCALILHPLLLQLRKGDELD